MSLESYCNVRVFPATLLITGYYITVDYFMLNHAFIGCWMAKWVALSQLQSSSHMGHLHMELACCPLSVCFSFYCPETCKLDHISCLLRLNLSGKNCLNMPILGRKLTAVLEFQAFWGWVFLAVRSPGTVHGKKGLIGTGHHGSWENGRGTVSFCLVVYQFSTHHYLGEVDQILLCYHQNCLLNVLAKVNGFENLILTV